MGSRSTSRHGKTPPVDSFHGETYDLTFNDYLPALKRAVEWNAWSDKETHTASWPSTWESPAGVDLAPEHGEEISL